MIETTRVLWEEILHCERTTCMPIYKLISFVFFLLPAIGCGDPGDDEFKLELNGEVIGTYDSASGLVEFDAEPKIRDRLTFAFAGDASISLDEEPHAITSSLDPIQLVAGLAKGDELTLTFDGEQATVLLVLEHERVALPNENDKATTSSARGNIRHKQTCQKHWFHGQKNRNKDCKWPWNCRGVYAASHPQYGDGISGRCVCHL